MADLTCDIAVIGAGIAGTSVAAQLALSRHVVLLEQEAVPAYHTTGRSAAVFAPCYGPAGIRALTRASETFFRDPGRQFASDPLVSDRSILLLAREDQLAMLDQVLELHSGQSHVTRVAHGELKGFNCLIRSSYACAGLLDTHGLDINVAALHEGYLKQCRHSGGTLLTNAAVCAVEHKDGCWYLHSGAGTVKAGTLVNAAGAWADHVALMAGVQTVNLVPKRRTAVIVEKPTDIDTQHMPITIDIDEQFYLKPEGKQLLISPADETPSEPCDTQPEDIDVAICIDRISRAFDLDIQRPLHQWAGLRSFVNDGEPVVGFAPDAEGFFWLAGQGGYGIQTAPAMASLSAALILGQPLPAEISDQGLDLRTLEPGRASLQNT